MYCYSFFYKLLNDILICFLRFAVWNNLRFNICQFWLGMSSGRLASSIAWQMAGCKTKSNKSTIFLLFQDVKYDYTANLAGTGTGDRSEYDIESTVKCKVYTHRLITHQSSDSEPASVSTVNHLTWLDLTSNRQCIHSLVSWPSLLFTFGRKLPQEVTVDVYTVVSLYVFHQVFLQVLFSVFTKLEFGTERFFGHIQE